MAITSYLNSLMEFNRRVLCQGDVPRNNEQLTAADIKQLMFFNEVFIGNTTEMFQKYPMADLADEYVENLNHYISNVAELIDIFRAIYPDTMFSMIEDFNQRLEARKAVSDQLIMQSFELLVEARRYQYDPNTIYYLTPVNNGVIITFIDPKRDVYSKGIRTTISDHNVFYKTDYAIASFINSVVPVKSTTVTVKVTTNKKTRQPSKIEFCGDVNTMRRLMPMFPDTVLMISNPFIFTKDIMAMFDSKIPKEKEIPSAQNFEPVDFTKLFYKDRLIEFPNDSFDEYLQFLMSAVANPNTESIYLTLYRIGDDPALYLILREAARAGIKVVVNIELMATGEDINKFWMDEMRSAGIMVTTYGYGSLKVHTKLTLVCFRNGSMVAQIGTGNYHTKTTRQYTDLCLITGNESICRQVMNVFKIFAGKNKMDFDKNFLVTRYNARDELHDLIMKQANRETNGFISFKCNALDDQNIIADLQYAMDRGCCIDLVVRGVCTWVPQDYSHVRIRSIIWDKLEHSRVYCFGRTNPEIYLGSLDLVTHKLDKRIETLVRVQDPDIVLRVCNYLNRYITNTSESWVQTSSGMYLKET